MVTLVSVLAVGATIAWLARQHPELLVMLAIGVTVMALSHLARC